MQKDTISERELAHSFVRNLPWLTVALSFLSVVLTAIIQNNETDTAFSLQLKSDSVAALLAFNSLTPFAHFGLPILSSFFAHTDFEHLLSNMVWLWLFGSVVELKMKRLRLLQALLVGHLVALLGGYIAATVLSSAPVLMGMSGGVAFLALMYMSKTLSRGKAVSITILLTALSAFQSAGFFLTHAAPALAGCALGFVLNRRQQAQKARNNATFPLASATKKESSNTATGA